MRVLVDSSVWIDFLRNNKTTQTDILTNLILCRYDICICGFIFTEVLQGIRDENQHLKTKSEFLNLVYLSEDFSTFDLASSIYRELRKQGITIRSTIDCMIAAIVIQNDVYFLESDKDFALINEHYPLKRIEDISDL